MVCCSLTLFAILANGGKEPRGIRGAFLIGGNNTFKFWKIQGNQVRLQFY